MNNITPLDLFSVFRNGAFFIGEFPINRRLIREMRSTQVLNSDRDPRVFDDFECRDNPATCHLRTSRVSEGRNVTLDTVSKKRGLMDGDSLHTNKPPAE